MRRGAFGRHKAYGMHMAPPRWRVRHPHKVLSAQPLTCKKIASHVCDQAAGMLTPADLMPAHIYAHHAHTQHPLGSMQASYLWGRLQLCCAKGAARGPQLPAVQSTPSLPGSMHLDAVYGGKQTHTATS